MARKFTVIDKIVIIYIISLSISLIALIRWL